MDGCLYTAFYVASQREVSSPRDIQKIPDRLDITVGIDSTTNCVFRVRRPERRVSQLLPLVLFCRAMATSCGSVMIVCRDFDGPIRETSTVVDRRNSGLN